MKYYCLMYRIDTENINPRVCSTINGKIMLLSKCAKCVNKNIKIY